MTNLFHRVHPPFCFFKRQSGTSYKKVSAQSLFHYRSLVKNMAQESVRCFVVINADDFGYSGPRNKGIVEAFTDGLVSSVSLLVNATSTMEAVKLAKKFNIPMGLHLNLTEGLPVGNKHSSLIGSDGFFLGKFGFRQAIEKGTVDMNEVIFSTFFMGRTKSQTVF